MGSGSTKRKTPSQIEELISKKTSNPSHCGFFWQRGDLIGEGGYGQVYECLNIDTGELYATKFVELTGDKEIQELRQEIALLKEVRHRNIVRYIATDVASDYSGVDIIMEYVPGGSVRTLLDKFSKLHEKTVQKYIKQVLQGLSYLHSNGIIHRDIKCANLLLCNDGTIKITDFGASKKLETSNLGLSLRGTPYWMAPEVARRTGHGSSADIWSVGCTTLEMLTGSPPWSHNAKDFKRVLDLVKQAKKPPEIPTNISDKCTDFVVKCLQIDPLKRPSAQDLLLHPFFENEISVHEDELPSQSIQHENYELEYDIEDLPAYDIDDIPETHLKKENAAEEDWEYAMQLQDLYMKGYNPDSITKLH